jgi:hypothetical protein
LGERGARRHRDDRLDDQTFGQKSRNGLLDDLEVVIIEADHPERERHAQHNPDVRILRVRPQQCRYQQAREDHQATHRGRALFGDQVRLRAVAANRLALALLAPQQVDDGRQKNTKPARSDDRTAGAKRDVPKHVQERFCRQLGQPVGHWVAP